MTIVGTDGLTILCLIGMVATAFYIIGERIAR